MSERTIYEALIQGGLNHIGALAIIGNMMAESGLRPNNLQDSYNNALGYTDEGYTLAVDSGAYSDYNFKTDSAGYGLCQWTYAPRKMNLRNFARERRTSIGDEAMQVAFCLKELRNEYYPLYNYLCVASNLREATERVCVEYERPSVNNVATRHQYAIEIGKRLEAQGVAAIDGGENVERKETAAEQEADYDYIADIEAHARAIVELCGKVRG